MSTLPVSKSRPFVRKLKRLGSDLGIPLAAGIAWAGITALQKPGLNLVELIGAGSAAAFFAGWLWRTFSSASKKVDDDDRHEAVIGAQEKLLANLETMQLQLVETAKETANYATGGDSYAFEGFTRIEDEEIVKFTFAVTGKYPLQDATVRISDMLAFKAAVKNRTGPLDTRHCEIARDHFVSMTRGFGYECKARYSLRGSTRVAFHINWAARNGSWYQRLEFAKVGDVWCRATFIRRGQSEEILATQADGPFPRDAAGNPLFTAATD